VQLSKREIEIIELRMKGRSTKSIAKKLFINERTVEAHNRNIKQKTGAENTAQTVYIYMTSKQYKK